MTLKDTVREGLKSFSRMFLKVPFNNSRWKERVSKKIMIGFRQSNINVVPGNVRRVSSRNYID